jgi:uncharacterized repeat protein (TIGR01451 family)
MKQKLIIFVLLALCCAPVKSALALGTASGTAISNSVTATYTIGVSAPQTITASVTFLVDNVVNVTVVKNGDAEVLPGSTDQVLVFALRNDGNTTQRYALSAVNESGIVMDNVRIYLDNGDTPGSFDANDTLYTDAATFGDVPADTTLSLLIVADTPAAATSGQTSSYNLVATTVDATTTTVTQQMAGPNTAGVDVVFADLAGTGATDTARNGQHSALGAYTVGEPLALDIAKSAVISEDPQNGAINPVALPGATLAYTLEVTVTGSGTAANVVVTDPVPANSTYKAGTLKLNGVGLTDIPGDDVGNVGGGPVIVTVKLGDLTSASAVQTITFDVLIDAYQP